MKNRKKTLYILGAIILTLALILTLSFNVNLYTEEKIDPVEVKINTIAYESSADEFMYLSDVEPYSHSQYGSLILNNSDGQTRSLYVEGNRRYFNKVIFAHAASTLIYQVDKYGFDYFTAYMGLDARQGSKGNGIIFSIYTSNDGNEWTKVDNSAVLKGTDNAHYAEIDIRNTKFLKLVCDHNGHNGNDHAIYVDAKLVKESYIKANSFIKTLDEYDNEIKSLPYETLLQNNELLLLQRNLVKNAGYRNLQDFARSSDENKNFLTWLMNDLSMLRDYTIGGKPNGSYIASFEVFKDLYNTYKNDLEDNTISPQGVRLGDLYKKMMISLALSHSKNVRFWINDQIIKDGIVTYNTDPLSPNISNALKRYQIFKDQYLNGKLNNKIFEQLEIEEMRYIMVSDIPDDEIKWVRDYTEKNGSTNPYSYLRYTTKVSYWNSQYYSEENRSKWDEKYDLSSYGISYQPNYPHLWIIFEQGGVCWQISNTGQNIYSAYGIPSTTVGQPGHVAYLLYSLNDSNEGMWDIWNDVGGWTQTNDKGYSNQLSYYRIRWMNDWGGGSYASPFMGSYILLAQAAINDFENYQNAERQLLLEDTFKDDKVKLESIYRKALNTEKINFDAWLGLVNLYIDSNKSEEELLALANEITTNLKYYPLPMYDLLRLLESHITTVENDVRFTLLQTKALTEATTATDADIIQSKVVRQMANFLLGKVDNEVATFSFDGENAKMLSLASRFQASNATWDYSLDNGATWKQVTEKSIKLSDNEINSITSTSDIKVHIVGTNYNEENIYTIDIKKSSAPTGLYANDLENKVIGTTDKMEWRLSNETAWKLFNDETPDLSGDKVIIIRTKATGLYLASPEANYTFTKNEDTPNKKYVHISEYSIHDVSSEETSKGAIAHNAIDGNKNTLWHSAYNGSDSERYITIRLAHPIYLSSLYYVPRASGTNGIIKDAVVSVSMDGKTWVKAGRTTWDKSNNTKNIDFPEAIEAQYIKLQALTNYGDGRNFISASMIYFYEDTTKTTEPTAELEYSETTATNKDVTVTLKNPSRPITITNNEGSNTFTFKENGEFTFKFVDEKGTKGSETAIVNWIDRVSPTPTITYDKTEATNTDVTATITFDEETDILDNDHKNTYTFTENGTFEFSFQDKAGNMGTAIAKVSWIDKVAPVGIINYDITTPTTGPVTATIEFNETANVINNNKSNKYTFTENGTFEFKFKDLAGNEASLVAEVNWITKETKPVEPDKPTEPNKPTESNKPNDTSTPSNTNKPNNNNENNSHSVNNTTTNHNSANSNKLPSNETSTVTKPNNNNSSDDDTSSKEEDKTDESTTIEEEKDDNKESNSKDDKKDDDKSTEKENTKNYTILIIIIVVLVCLIGFTLIKRKNTKDDIQL